VAWQGYIQGSISSTFYEQLLWGQIPNAQKKTYNFTVFFALLGFAPIKAVQIMLMKLSPDEDCAHHSEPWPFAGLRHLAGIAHIVGIGLVRFS
jgi:hypothetical protein